MEPKHIKAFISEKENSVDEVTHRILFIIPEIVDRDDEIVTAQAIYDALRDKETFAANPICMPCHQHRLDSGKPPCVGHWDIDTAQLINGSVEVWLIFAIGTELGDEYWKCYSQKHMRAVSIGYHAREWHREERDGNGIDVTTKIELYEISCVAVGANQGALSKLKTLFGWTDEKEALKDIESLIQVIVSKLLDDKVSKLQTEISEQFDEIKLLFIPDSDKFAESLLGQGSESLVPADKNNAENVLQQILKIIKNSRE